MSRAVFLDRDGVINRKARGEGYITRWEEIDLLPGVAEGISLLNRFGFLVVIVTNQRCVAKGLLSMAELEAIHAQLCNQIAAMGGRIDQIYYCPHEKDPPCTCRKPSPGMLLAAAREHRIDLKLSWVVGDSDDDVEAGKVVGCKTARIIGPYASERITPDLVASSLLGAVRELLLQENGEALHISGHPSSPSDCTIRDRSSFPVQ